MRRDRLHYLFPVIALASLAAVTSWLARISQPPPEDDSEMSSKEPDMVVNQFTLQRFDVTGKQQYIFSADEMRHFTNPDRTELARPELLFLAHGAPVAAVARVGTVSAKGESVRLSGNVVVTREAGTKRAAEKLETESLTLWPETERAVGDVPVRYREGGNEVTAGSFTADNRADTLTLDGGMTATFRR